MATLLCRLIFLRRGIPALVRAGVGCGLVLAAMCALLLAPAASAYDVPPRLNEVARVYSLGVGEVRCPSQAEWDAYYGSAFAWGSTNLREDYTTLAPFICAGALTVGSPSVPLWQQAAGVWVLVRGVPPPLALPAQRGEGRLPDDRLLQGRRDEARRKRGAGRGALPLRARAPHPPSRALLLVPGQDVPAAALVSAGGAMTRMGTARLTRTGTSPALAGLVPYSDTRDSVVALPLDVEP